MSTNDLSRAGLHQINRYLVGGVHPRGNAVQPPYLPREALPGPAEPHPGSAWLAQPGRPRLHHQRKGKIR